MSKSVVVLLLGGAMFLFGIGLSVHAQVVVKVRYPRIYKALGELQTTRMQLVKIPAKFGGHRTLAIRNLDLAIFELQQAMQVPPRP